MKDKVRFLNLSVRACVLSNSVLMELSRLLFLPAPSLLDIFEKVEKMRSFAKVSFEKKLKNAYDLIKNKS